MKLLHILTQDIPTMTMLTKSEYDAIVKASRTEFINMSKLPQEQFIYMVRSQGIPIDNKIEIPQIEVINNINHNILQDMSNTLIPKMTENGFTKLESLYMFKLLKDILQPIDA